MTKHDVSYQPKTLSQEEIEQAALELLGREMDRLQTRERLERGLSDKDLGRLQKLVSTAVQLRRARDPELELLKKELASLHEKAK